MGEQNVNTYLLKYNDPRTCSFNFKNIFNNIQNDIFRVKNTYSKMAKYKIVFSCTTKSPLDKMWKLEQYNNKRELIVPESSSKNWLNIRRISLILLFIGILLTKGTQAKNSLNVFLCDSEGKSLFFECLLREFSWHCCVVISWRDPRKPSRCHVVLPVHHCCSVIAEHERNCSPCVFILYFTCSNRSDDLRWDFKELVATEGSRKQNPVSLINSSFLGSKQGGSPQ